jgi:hypothetical protein
MATTTKKQKITTMIREIRELTEDADRETLIAMFNHAIEAVRIPALNNLYWELLDIRDEDDPSDEEPRDGFRDDVEADADVLASAGWGTDEDYGYYGDD